MPIALSFNSKIDEGLRKLLNEISVKAVDGTIVPLFVSYTNNRVGIGTSSPQYTLDVTGDLRATGKVLLQAAYVLGMLSARNLDVPGAGSFNILSALTAYLNDIDVLGKLTVTSSGAGSGLILTSTTGKHYALGVVEDDQNNPTLTLTQVP